MNAEGEEEDSKDLIEKKVKLNHDGRQFFVRIPKRISNFFNLEEEENYEAQFTVDVEKVVDEKIREINLVIQKEDDQ
ncbi:hypothetical protein AKJ50_00575 [candidate division MSBL1 archaeon SCGC-AAA382A13]|uniref:Uncharacterized protein n=1 Tax=candidate division MSBL1 archaeon SCGC-AAA382A13 TaxID=1698279 RepID=A0A133VGL4_9EURY|nr:hypothetical protein AKJ50_00575 [candidate division MSBL1 archaeon SCGC-AAA382A13]